MKLAHLGKLRFKSALAGSLFIVVILLMACEPLVYTFDSVEEAVPYKAAELSAVPAQGDTLNIMTWNIRFGAGRLPWFGDACGERVILTREEVETNLERVAEKINEINPDILFLEEVDVQSKRTTYIDEMQWLLDHTHLNYGVFGSIWHAQYIPSDGLGRMNLGTAILSRWPLLNPERIALPLRSDQDALTQYFYLRRCIVKTEVEVSNAKRFYAVGVHAAAFSTDDTKQKHIDRFLQELIDINDAGFDFVAGGDLNTLPPGSDSTDFCMEDACPGESFHHAGDDPFHKEGSDYTNEADWLDGLYNRFHPAVPLFRYQADQQHYFTHTTNHPNGFWNRKLDYLFSNQPFVAGSDSTHQEAKACSDHAPVSAKWRVPK